jgi:predicted kinase
MRVALMSGPELVIFVGPPYSSKTLYYFQHYASTHERISARELFQNEATRGLRHVILALTDLLKQGKNVVLDDDNWSRETRTSYIRSVKKKVSIAN